MKQDYELLELLQKADNKDLKVLTDIITTNKKGNRRSTSH